MLGSEFFFFIFIRSFGRLFVRLHAHLPILFSLYVARSRFFHATACVVAAAATTDAIDVVIVIAVVVVVDVTADDRLILSNR